MNLKVNIAGIEMKNSLMNASGCPLIESQAALENWVKTSGISRAGALVEKTHTLEPREGNQNPRMAEVKLGDTRIGMLNSIGLKNPGIDVLINQRLPFLANLGVPIIVSFAGKSIEEYVKFVERINQFQQEADSSQQATAIAGLEVNISCPNVKSGLVFGVDGKATYDLIKALKKITSFPLVVKLTPNVTNIVEIAESAEEAGADALSLVNTLLAMAIDIKTGQPKIKNNFGGLSGPAIKPVAVRMVYQVSQAVKIPVIGMGGIQSAEDIIEFMMAGASAVAIGAANFGETKIINRLIDDLEKYCQDNNIEDINNIVGTVKLWS